MPARVGRIRHPLVGVDERKGDQKEKLHTAIIVCDEVHSKGVSAGVLLSIDGVYL